MRCSHYSIMQDCQNHISTMRHTTPVLLRFQHALHHGSPSSNRAVLPMTELLKSEPVTTITAAGHEEEQIRLSTCSIVRKRSLAQQFIIDPDTGARRR